MALNKVGAFEDKTAVTTAVFLYMERPNPILEQALHHIQAAMTWDLLKYKLIKSRAEAFRCIKAPALIIYDASGNETIRAIGDIGITNLIECFKDDMFK